MNAILFDQTDRLRSGWRAAVFVVAFFVAVLPLAIVAEIVLSEFGVDRTAGSPAFLAINGIVSIIPALLIGWACGRLFESLPFAALGASLTGGWLRHWLIGCGLGAFTFLVAVLPAFFAGALRFGPGNEPGSLATGVITSFLILAVAAAFEEVLFRGYLFQTLTRSGLTWLAIALTSVGFGLVHARNPDATSLSVINTILAGVWFAAAYLKTRDLWFVWGLHLMWNWTQGAVFGIEISGFRDLTPSPVFREIDNGPAWLTGGDYGIEGSIGATVAITISIILIYFLPGLKPQSAATRSES